MQRQVNKAGPTGAEVPPPDPRPYVPQITLPAERECHFQCLHPSVSGFWMHWVDNQHYPHVKDWNWCAGCKIGQTPRWEGFIGVLSLNTLKRFVMKVPAAAFRESGLFRERSDAGLLQGTIFTAYRFGKVKSKNNPAIIEVTSPTLPAPKPRPFPLYAALARYWRMETLDQVDQVSVLEDIKNIRVEALRDLAEKAREAGFIGRRSKP